MNRRLILLSVFFFTIAMWKTKAQSIHFAKYHTVAEVDGVLQKLSQSGDVKIHNLTKTAGGNQYSVLEIGTETGKSEKNLPAIFVVANAEGNRPLATEAALYLAQELLKHKEKYAKLSWYILAEGNPDAAEAYFYKSKYERVVNKTAINDDRDDAVNEDGFEDLNNDGFITQMRVKAPDGDYIIDPKSELFMRKADVTKGEKGVYKIYTEGIDNDKDGKYNEDADGGVDIGISFPHLFGYHQPKSGLFPGSEKETFALMQFIYQHPEIAMTFTFGNSNFCLQKPKAGRKAKADMNNIKIPKRYAKFLGADVNKSYTMAQVMEMVQKVVPPGMKVDESMIASMLGLGAAVNPNKKDLKFYKLINEDYKKYLEDKKVKQKRLEAGKAKNGSFELWTYYQLGIPSFSMDVWAMPEAKQDKKKAGSGISLDKLKKMSKDEFLAKGKDTIALFLNENEVSKQFTAEKVMEMVRTDKITPAQMSEMMKQMSKNKPKKTGELTKEQKAFIAYNRDVLNGDGFVNWQKYNHPQLGEVEIGGIKPFVKTTPLASRLDSILKLKVPYVFRLSEKLAHLKLKDVKVEKLGGGVYRVDVFVENRGELPFTTAMGKRNKQPVPAQIDISGADLQFLEGHKHEAIQSVDALSVVKKSYLLQSDKAKNITIKLSSKQAWGDVKNVELK